MSVIKYKSLVINEKSKILLSKLKNTDEEVLEWELFLILKPMAYKTAINIYRDKYFNIPLDYEDFESTIYMCYQKTLSEYRLNKIELNIFLVCFSKKVIQSINRYCNKFLTNSQKTLNYVVDDITNGNSIEYQNEKNEIDQLKLQLEIENLLTICKKDEWKDIIILRLKGYKEQEIAKILNLSIKKISNEFLSMKKFLKENYF